MIRYHQELLLMISALQIEADARKRHKVYGLKPHIKLWLNMVFFSQAIGWYVISFIWKKTAAVHVTDPFFRSSQIGLMPDFKASKSGASGFLQAAFLHVHGDAFLPDLQ